MTKKKEEDEMEKMDILSSEQQVADELNMSLWKFRQLRRTYPFEKSGAPSKLMGSWRVTKEDVVRWFRYVQRQEMRHPDARRMRPEEPPELQGIKGRSGNGAV